MEKHINFVKRLARLCENDPDGGIPIEVQISFMRDYYDSETNIKTTALCPLYINHAMHTTYTLKVGRKIEKPRKWKILNE